MPFTPFFWPTVAGLALIISALLVIFLKSVFKNTLSAHIARANAPIGETALVIERICNAENKGLVKVRGQVFGARSADGDELAEGERVSVISIEGVRLICRKTEPREK